MFLKFAPSIMKNIFYNVIKTIICIKIYFKIIIVNFTSFVRISTSKF